MRFIDAAISISGGKSPIPTDGKAVAPFRLGAVASRSRGPNFHYPNVDSHVQLGTTFITRASSQLSRGLSRQTSRAKPSHSKKEKTEMKATLVWLPTRAPPCIAWPVSFNGG
jgi:hypothetical protein